MIKPEDLIVVIRSAGERTRELCKKVVKEQIDGGELHEVEIAPFKKALEKTFELAIESKKRWLITVDADMILTRDSVKVLLREAKKMPGHYIQLQGRIIDKIMGIERKAGPRVYRIDFLEKLLELSRVQPDYLRPENSIISKIGETGHPSRYIHYVTCIHDFGQYYKDIYRKVYVHARKHSELLGQVLKNGIELKEKNDSDYRLILKAVFDSLTEPMEVNIDTTIFKEKSEKACETLGLREKTNLSKDDESKIDELINVYSSTKGEKQYIYYYDKPAEENGSLLKKLKQNGLWQSIRNRLGTLLIKFGKKIKY